MEAKKQPPFIAICALAVLVAAGAGSLDAHAQCNIYMRTNQQAIDGYGFSSAWCGTLSTAKNNALYGTLGMSLLRVQIDSSGPGGGWDAEIANAAAAHAAGVKVLGSCWFAPGEWRGTRLNSSGDPQEYLLPEHYADFANWLAQARSSINLDWVSPANEPDIGWMAWTSDELRTWIGQYGGSLGAPLLAPESCGFNDEYTDAIIDDPTAGPNVSVVGGHGYIWGLPWVHSDPISQGKHVWMTENYLTGGQDTIGESVAIAQNISDYMNNQFSAYISWWVTDNDTNCNLVYSDGTIYKNGYAMGQFAKWIRPGSTRVSANYTPSAGVSVTAYNVNGSAVIVAVNANTNGSVNQQFVINNGNGAALEGYRTSSNQSMADIGSFTVSSGSFTANLPAQSITTFVQTNGTPPNLPPPWSAQDIGVAGIVGSSTYTNSVVTNGVFTVTASGNDIWNTADAFRFVYETNGGNCTIIARVRSEQSTNAMAKAGVMIRNSLNPAAANAFIGVTASNGVVFQYRSSTGGVSSSNRVTGLSAPYWVKLVQSGSTVAGYYSANGTSWTQLGTTTTISLGSMQTNAWGQVSGPIQYAGLAFCNNGNASLGTAAFDNVSAPGWPLPAPSAPTGLTATGGVEQVTLNWQASSYATNYIIRRATVSGGPYTPIATSWRGTSYIDYGLVGGTTYYYVVMAVNGVGQSTNSAQASATPTVNVPSPWLAQDIGSVGLYGSESFTNGVFTVTASGNDIWDTADALRFVYVPVTNNCTIIARVASLQNVDGWSKAGVMIRASLASNAPNAFVAVTPGNGVTWQYRSTTGGTTANATTGGLSAPYWVKLVRSGNVFTGYVSPDGTNWTQQGTATFTMATNAYVGLAVTAHNNSDLCEATFDHVTGPGWTPPSASTPAGLVATAGIEQVALSWMATSNANAGYNVYRATTSGGPYSNVANVTTTNYTDTGLNDRTTYYYVVTAVNSLAGESANSAQVSATTTVPVPYPWLTRDVGSVGLAGSASFTNGVFTVTGSGADIQGTADAFRFVYVATNSGNYSIIARVASLQNIDGWSKAGVMIRDSLDPGAANVFVAVTPSNGATFQYRSSDGGGCNYSTTSGSAPYWVKLVMSNGTNFTGYCSPDGTNWTQAGSTTLTSVTNAYIGLAVTGHNNTNLCTATFDNVSGSGWQVAPAGLSATAVSTNQINLVWNAFANATNYVVKRSLTNGGPYAVIASTGTATNYQDKGLAWGTMYYYAVSAIVSGAAIPNSAHAVAATFSPTLGSLVHRYSFSETNGATVADSVGGPAWAGTLPNGGTLGGGQLTLSSNSQQYASLPAGIVNGLTNFTIMAWVNLTSASDWSRLFDIGNNATTNMFLTPQCGGSGTVRFAITTSGGGAEQQINSSSKLSTGAWHQVAVTLNSGIGILYMDGVAVGTNSSMTLNPSSLGNTVNNYIGKSQYPDPYLNGALDEFRIYNRALTAADVALMNADGPSQTYLAGTVTLGNLSQTYDGSAKSVTATPTPIGLTVDITYSGSANAPTNAGSYTVIGTISDANYQGSATNTLVISKSAGTVTLGSLSQNYDGTAKSASATTTPTNLTVNLTYGGSANAPTNAGSYTVIGTISDANYQGSATNTLVISKGTGTVTLGNLSQTYDGAAKSVSATTTPTNLTVNITYNGSANAPTNAGSYTAIGVINDANYQGSATNTLVISSASRPQMSLALTRTNLAVSWPYANTGYTLQSCTNLTLGNWLNVTSPAAQNVGGNWQVSLPPATNAGAMFYRLSNINNN